MIENHNNSISISSGTIFRFFFVGFLFVVFWFLKDLFLVILTAIVFASFVEAFIPYFKKIKIGRVFGVVIFYVIFLAILATLFYLFAPILISEIYNFGTFISTFAPEFESLDFLQDEAFLQVKDTVQGLSDGFSLSSMLMASREFIQNLSGGFLKTFSVIFGGIFNFVLILIIAFYLSAQEKGIENFLKVILPLRYENKVIDLWQRTNRKIALWIKGQLFLGLIIAVLTYLVLAILGIQYAILLAIIAGVMVIVPYGLIVALIPAVSLAYVSGGVTSAFLVAGAYLILSQFESFLLTPLIVNKVVGLSPLVVILAVLIGYELIGFWGVVLAIPVAVFLMELYEDVEKNKKILKNNNEQI